MRTLLTLLVLGFVWPAFSQSDLDNPRANIDYVEARQDLPKTIVVRENEETGEREVLATDEKVASEEAVAAMAERGEFKALEGTEKQGHELDSLNPSKNFYFYFGLGYNYPYANYSNYYYNYRPYYNYYYGGYNYNCYTWYNRWWY